MKIIESPTLLQEMTLAQKSIGKTIGFVPTMGALHKGHTSLMDIARTRCDLLVVSIYVNPLQFAAGEDLDTYPHTPEEDHLLCEQHGVDIVFRPTDLYPPNHSTTVSISGLTNGLCGSSRPTHFDGVTTVVARLFGIVQPTIAVFGQKDFQQLSIIRRMVKDLAMPIEIIGGPIIRETDGLALSSRNTYLSTDERGRALSLSKALHAVQSQIDHGETNAEVLKALVTAILTVDNIDYISFVHQDTLEPVQTVDEQTQLCIAAYLGSTRLIDNGSFSFKEPL